MDDEEYLPMPWAVTVSTSCCSTRDRAAAPAHTPIISASVWDTPQEKLRSWRRNRVSSCGSIRVSQIYFNTMIQQDDGQIQMLKKNFSRGEMVLWPQAQLLKQRGVSSYSTVAKVAQCRDYFNHLWECPLATTVQSEDKFYLFYIVPVCKSSSSDMAC